MRAAASVLIGLAAAVSAHASTPSPAPSQEAGPAAAESWGNVHDAYRRALRQTDPAAVVGDLPPLALARARLLLKSDPQEAAYQGWLAYYRMQWDAYHCTDQSASQGLAIVITEMHDADPNFLTSISDPARKLPAFKRLLAEDAVFATPSRPWWICSHGMNAVISGARTGWSRPDSELGERQGGWRRTVQAQITDMEASAR
jgi:hypothetical protein